MMQDMLEFFDLTHKLNANQEELLAHQTFAVKRCQDASNLSFDPEVYRTVPIKKLFRSLKNLQEQPSKAALGSGKERADVVFEDGLVKFPTGHDDDTLYIGKAADAEKKFGFAVSQFLKKVVQNESDPFALASLASHDEELYLYVFDDAEADRVIHLDIHPSAKQVSHPKAFIHVGENASIKILCHNHMNSMSKQILNQLMYLKLEANAKVELLFTANPFHDLTAVESLRADLAEGATLNVVIIGSSSDFYTRNIQVALQGEKATASVKALNMLADEMHSHLFIKMHHQAPSTFSNQLVKNLLGQKSIADFEGKISIDSCALLSDAYQLASTLLQSDEAKVLTRPNLEIRADDVKASHGATVSRLSEEEMFYLCSRGLTKKDAERFTTFAFLHEILDEIFDDDAKAFWQQYALYEALAFQG